MTEEAVGLLTRWRARLVTYGLVILLATAVWQHTEAWPVTSYRLFSSVRTGTSSGLQLVAVSEDGTTQRVAPRGETVSTTAHRYGDLPGLAPEERRRLVRTWLLSADIDPETVRVVRLERVTRALDPDGGPAVETGRRIIIEVEP